jgi:hypothetical protein
MGETWMLRQAIIAAAGLVLLAALVAGSVVAQDAAGPGQVLVGYTDWVLSTPSAAPSDEALEAVQDALAAAIERNGDLPVEPIYLVFQTPDSTIVDAVSTCGAVEHASGCKPGTTYYVFPAARADGRARLNQTGRFLQW